MNGSLAAPKQRNGWPEPNLVCCGNCAHLAWLVALGQGIRCAQPENRAEARANGLKDPPVIPGRTYVCPRFQWKHEQRAQEASV